MANSNLPASSYVSTAWPERGVSPQGFNAQLLANSTAMTNPISQKNQFNMIEPKMMNLNISELYK